MATIWTVGVPKFPATIWTVRQFGLSQGPDRLPPKILKELSQVLAEPLCNLFNFSLQEGKLPSDWKKGEITAIFKKGSKMEPGNYRPVSLTCVLCKVLESFVRDGMVNHLSDNNLYAECQHGFRRARSCVTQLLLVMERLTKYFDEGIPVDIIYLDFRKAFDSVPHERLLTKLKAYGISGNILEWIRNFLLGRTQRVKVGSAISSESPVLSGIPQGSILGPVLFTAFINDMPADLVSLCHIFADDTKIYNSAMEKDKLQADVFKLQEWSERWNLYFNVSKCHVMHLGAKNPRVDYTMRLDNDLKKIDSCIEEKDLGVTFDEKLSFDPHIHRVVKKANQMLGLIKRSFLFMNKDIFLKLFKSFVRPHIEYANVIWSPHLKRQSIYIENVQRRATKLLDFCKDMSYEERLRELQLHSLKGRRDRGDLIQMYEIYNGYDDINFHNLFNQVQCNITRNPVGKVQMGHCNTNIRKYTFTNRVITNWNALPPNVKNAKNITEFKIFLDKDPKLSQLFYGFD